MTSTFLNHAPSRGRSCVYLMGGLGDLLHKLAEFAWESQCLGLPSILPQTGSGRLASVSGNCAEDLLAPRLYDVLNYEMAIWDSPPRSYG